MAAPQLVGVVDVPPRGGTSRLWQALLALTNFGLVRMLAGNTGPLPEKFGLGRLYPCWRTQVTYLVTAACESWKRRPRAREVGAAARLDRGRQLRVARKAATRARGPPSAPAPRHRHRTGLRRPRRRHRAERRRPPGPRGQTHPVCLEAGAQRRKPRGTAPAGRCRGRRRGRADFVLEVVELLLPQAAIRQLETSTASKSVPARLARSYQSCSCSWILSFTSVDQPPEPNSELTAEPAPPEPEPEPLVPEPPALLAEAPVSLTDVASSVPLEFLAPLRRPRRPGGRSSSRRPGSWSP